VLDFPLQLLIGVVAALIFHRHPERHLVDHQLTPLGRRT
jgi:hypothetical protein